MITTNKILKWLVLIEVATALLVAPLWAKTLITAWITAEYLKEQEGGK